jgi:hypothetical protein
MTQRDIQATFAKAIGETVDEKWLGPHQDNDALYNVALSGAIFDGVRILDGKYVVFKIVNTTWSYEAEIYTYLKLGDPAVSNAEQNKTIPVFDVLKLSSSRTLVVTEMWSPYWNFHDVEDWERFSMFVRQVLEGLAFLHSHRIAHLDISDGNILSGPLEKGVPPHKRPFAFIDFEYSVIYPKSNPGPYSVVGDIATYTAPEMSSSVSYDPFEADIWQMGTLLKIAAEERGFNQDALVDLFQKMTRDNPEERPDAEGALFEFLNVRRNEE